MMRVIVKPSTPRERMIQSAALLMRERGVEATSFSDVIEHSGAPRGSIYHHFPGGKAQLVEEATRFAGDVTAAALARAFASGDFAAAVDAFTGFWARTLRSSGFDAGCPVVAAAVEGERSPAARDAAGAAFERWEALIADALAESGMTAEDARSRAALLVAAVEGAVIVSRARRSTEPLERVAVELRRLPGR